METNENAVENLENLTTEELEAKADELDTSDDSSIDYKAIAEANERKANALQRILNKKKPIINNLSETIPTDTIKDIEEIKFYRKVDTFAEEHDLTKAQAEKVLKLYPNANADTLKDPFVANGLKAIVRKERVEDSTPGAGRATSVNGKTFKEMTDEEREANFSKFIPQ